MCGIAGLVQFEKGPVDISKLEKMGEKIRHRGPDDNGIWSELNVGLVHRRLSIIDLSAAGHQPFFSENLNLVLTYNGEIYNYREIRNELKAKGVQFRTNTDTEVLLKAFEIMGHNCLELFNGIFAFAVWDRKKGELFIARDRVGVKPLYYSASSSSFCFASEPKALFQAGIEASINVDALDEQIAYRYISGDNTIFSKIRRLLPGHYALIDSTGHMEINRWYNLGNKIKEHNYISDPQEWFRSVFHDSVGYRLVSDAPVGVLLSAGLDSSSVTKAIRNNGKNNLETFTIGFTNRDHDESDLVERFCSEMGFNSTRIKVEDKELEELIQSSGYYLDEPLTHLNDPHLLAISRVAKNKVSVLLSGEGADEFLGGYVRYKTFQYRNYWRILRSTSFLWKNIANNPRIKKLSEYLKIENEKLMQLSNASVVFPDSLVNEYGLSNIRLFPDFRLRILEEAESVYPNNPLRQLLYLDQHTYLQSLNDRNDRATMGASIECREPFMDYRLMEGLGALDDSFLFSGKKNKYILASTVGKQLPKYIQNFKKIGFSVPWDKYLKSNGFLFDNVRSLDKCELFESGILAKLNVNKLVEEFMQYDLHKPFTIQLVFIKIWYESYFKNIRQ